MYMHIKDIAHIHKIESLQVLWSLFAPDEILPQGRTTIAGSSPAADAGSAYGIILVI